MIQPNARGAWAELESQLRPFVARRLDDSSEVDDVLQDIWIAAFRRFKDFEDDRAFALDRWLRTIANRKLPHLTISHVYPDRLKTECRRERRFDRPKYQHTPGHLP